MSPLHLKLVPLDVPFVDVQFVLLYALSINWEPALITVPVVDMESVPLDFPVADLESAPLEFPTVWRLFLLLFQK